MILTPQHLAAVGAKSVWLAPLQAAVDKLGLATPEQVAMFLAQLSHESAGFSALSENLNYSVVALLKTWPGRFDTTSVAAYARQPQRIANRVYALRMGNGDEASGDGWRYRGRGLIQLTGRSNYAGAGQWLGLDLVADPDQVAEPQCAALTAAWFWQAHKLAGLAGDVAAVTRIINGGTLGLADRQRLYTAALAALTAKVGA